MSDYVTKLQQLAVNCEFANVNKEIKSQIIQCCASQRLRRKELKTQDMSLEALLDEGRALETIATSMQQALKKTCVL